MYIVFTPAFFESCLFLCSFWLFFFVCSHFFGPVIEKSINQHFTGAETLTFLILELEKFWRQFWKSQIKRRQATYVVFTIFTVFGGSRRAVNGGKMLTGPKCIWGQNRNFLNIRARKILKTVLEISDQT